MNRFMRWYNQNRKTVWKVIGIIVIVIIVIQLINHYYKVRNEEELNSNNQTQNETTNSSTNSNYNSVRVDDNNSVLSGDEMSSSQEEQIQIIDTFVDYCNKGDVESAYQLLTDECKQEMYPQLDNFINSYYNETFANSEKDVSVENWIGNIYKVQISENMLATGKFSKETTKQDYITVVETEDEQYKLNINGYIGRDEIDKSKEESQMKMTVKYKDTYMDYEEYTIEITNNSNVTILLDDGANVESMYIRDDNGNHYPAYTHEINSAELEVSPRETKEITIKYYSKYGSSKDINRLVFSRMILNYEAYEIFENKSLYNDYGVFEIEI